MFFIHRQVMEVDPPLLSQSVVTAPHLQSFSLVCDERDQARYLQTSPEYAMKRLLCAGSGSIYCLGKAFRKGEVGHRHNPEFTMLEWYRVDWDHTQLIAEVDTLFQDLLGCQSAKCLTYQEAFEHYFGINPHLAPVSLLQNIAMERQWVDQAKLPELDKDSWLDLLLSHGIEPFIGQTQPTVLVDFPASQASLAKTRLVEGPVSFEVAERFEFYFQGFELANGYHELSCPIELRKRFEKDLQQRKAQGLASLPIDEPLLLALASGFPPCAGVAVGVDRLLMLKLKEKQIAHVLPFAWEQA